MVDGSSTGSRFSGSASPSLAHILRETSEAIAHPTDANRTLWDATKDVGKYTGTMEEVAAETWAAEELMKSKDSLGVGALGSGSDYTVFLQHLGVRSVHANVSWQVYLSDMVIHRWLVLRLHTRLRSPTQCTTTTVCLTRRDGRSSMAIQDS